MKKKKTPKGVKEKDYAVWKRSLIELIDKMPHEDICRIGNSLNCHEWPDNLPGMPDGWDEMSPSERSLWTEEVFSYIYHRVGDKALLRHYHKTEYGRTDKEFEDWWDSVQHNSFVRPAENRYVMSVAIIAFVISFISLIMRIVFE